MTLKRMKMMSTLMVEDKEQDVNPSERSLPIISNLNYVIATYNSISNAINIYMQKPYFINKQNFLKFGI